MNISELAMFGLLVLLVGAAAAYWGARQPILRAQQDTSNLQAFVERLQVQLAEANQKIGELQAKVSLLEAELAKFRDARAVNNTLLVAVGADPMLQVDLAALRSVEARTDLRLTRLLPVTQENFRRTLDWHRRRGMPVRYVHLATHAGPAGVQFADGMADATWLSGELRGVEVLGLGGCETAGVGDLLELVPAVITMQEKLPNEDAWQFAAVFWQAIGEGLRMPEVEERCRQRLPARLMEYVEFRTWM
jgi:uncharacterized small protein (DUF1192 family)